MRISAPCNCGSEAVVSLTDSKSRRDPTGTASIRSQFRRQADLRLQRVKDSLRKAFDEHNVLGLNNGPQQAYAAFGFATGQRARMFNGWFNEEVYRTLVERDATWTHVFLRDAYAKGTRTARRDLGLDDQLIIGTPLGIYESMAWNELTGIADYMVQLVNRISMDALSKRKDCGPTGRDCIGRINKTVRERLYLMANTLTVRVYNDAKLAQYASNNVKRVGLLAETLPKKKIKRRVRDAVVLDQEDDVLEGRTPLYLRPDLQQGSIEILTAQDDAVCEDCQALADAGPYYIADVYGVLPVHPRCRCTWVQYGDPRLDEEFSE